MQFCHGLLRTILETGSPFSQSFSLIRIARGTLYFSDFAAAIDGTPVLSIASASQLVLSQDALHFCVRFNACFPLSHRTLIREWQPHGQHHLLLAGTVKQDLAWFCYVVLASFYSVR
jgi:hypothetical protein